MKLDTSKMINEELIFRINELRKQKNAIILAHNYQVPEVQDIADYIGDSLGLARKAAKTNAETIVFCGVHFMAETASVISSDKKVLIPDMEAGCSLAESRTSRRSGGDVCKYDCRSEGRNGLLLHFIQCDGGDQFHSQRQRNFVWSR